MQAPELTIRDLLRTNWDSTNTSITYDPDISTAWYQGEKDTPQVTVTNPDENPVRGGQTGYAAADGTGKGGVQEVGGTLQVDCWCDSEVEPDEGAKKVSYELAEEVTRIVMANQHSATDLRLISPGRRTFVPPDPDESPPVMHNNVSVQYIYEDRPP